MKATCELQFSPDDVKALLYFDELGRLYWRIKAGRRNRNPGDRADFINHEYMCVTFRGVRIRAHRIVWLLKNGAWPDGEIDHINGNKIDNRPSNLRVVCRAQNAQNVGLSRNNTSGVKGISWRRNEKRWVARCNVNGVSHEVGLFKTIDDAKAMLEKFRERAHGEFANHGRHSERRGNCNE